MTFELVPSRLCVGFLQALGINLGEQLRLRQRPLVKLSYSPRAVKPNPKGQCTVCATSANVRPKCQRKEAAAQQLGEETDGVANRSPGNHRSQSVFSC